MQPDKRGLSGCVLQIPLTGLFAGLTLGLLSLDIVGLKVGAQSLARACGAGSLLSAAAADSQQAHTEMGKREGARKYENPRSACHQPLPAAPCACSLHHRSTCPPPLTCSWVQILEEAGEPDERTYARKIMPGTGPTAGRGAPLQQADRLKPAGSQRCGCRGGSMLCPVQ